MDVREKLVEMAKPVLTSLPFPWCTVWRDVAEKIADAYIGNGVTVREWISVKDRLPEVGRIVLVSDNETDCHIWQYTNYSERGVAMPWMGEFGIPCKTEEITHWMPLPQPPKGETIYCKDCEHLMFSDCYGECSKGHKGIVKPNDTCKYATRKPPKGE